MKKTLGIFALATSALFSPPAFACQFYHIVHAGSESVKKRIVAQLPSLVTDEFCSKFAKTHSIFISADNYSTQKVSIGHATVGLIKIGQDNTYPIISRAGFRSRDGFWAVGVAHELAVQAVKDQIIDLMSDLDSAVK